VSDGKVIEPIAGYWRVEAVRGRLGLSSQQMRAFLRVARVTVFCHPSDKRIRLVRDEDAQRLLLPQPVRPRKNARIAA
jgi:hypothetical protein